MCRSKRTAGRAQPVADIPESLGEEPRRPGPKRNAATAVAPPEFTRFFPEAGPGGGGSPTGVRPRPPCGPVLSVDQEVMFRSGSGGFAQPLMFRGARTEESRRFLFCKGFFFHLC